MRVRWLQSSMDTSPWARSFLRYSLTVGLETGSSDDMLSRLSQIFFEDSLDRIDQIIDRIEPLFAAFLTITVGATLIAVMLPLIGIMRSIG